MSWKVEIVVAPITESTILNTLRSLSNHLRFPSREEVEVWVTVLSAIEYRVVESTEPVNCHYNNEHGLECEDKALLDLFKEQLVEVYHSLRESEARD